MNLDKKKTVLFFMLFGALSLTAQPVKDVPIQRSEAGFLSKLLLAPLTFAHFCCSSYTFVKRNQLAQELVTSKNEIDSYQVDILVLKRNKRAILRSKTFYDATFSGLHLHKVIDTCMSTIKKMDPKLFVIVKPSITTDAGPWYSLKSFTGYASDHKNFHQQLTDIFFVPEHETLTTEKKIATTLAPLSLGGIMLLFLIL